MSARYGGLMELVARGKKDVFFNANPSVSFFHSVYRTSAAFSKEIYVAKPRNVPEWGHWVDFDLEHRGDIAKHFYLRIDLPSWLPPPVAAINQKGIVTDASGISFGWCNSIGYQMIQKIQVFQDQVLLHEIYGEYLDWRLRQSYGMATTFMMAAEVGVRAETPLAIARSAGPRHLRVPIPLFGWQRLGDPGLPTTALRGQRFRIRVHLRRLRDLIVASDGRLTPAPWERPLRVQSAPGGPVDTTYTALPETAMRDLGVALESTQLYVPADVALWLRSRTLRFPILHIQAQTNTIEDTQMTAASAGAAVTLPFLLEFDGPADRLLIGFRTEANTLAGDRTNLRSPAGPEWNRIVPTRLVSSLRVNIANIDRIQGAPVALFREVAAYWKNYREPQDYADPSRPQEVYTLTFGGFDYGEPAGTLNFQRAVLPTLYATLNAVPFDTRNISRKTACIIYAETWNVFEIAGVLEN